MLACALLGALRGVLIAAMGASPVLLIDAASFLAGAVLVAALVPKPPSTVDRPAPERYLRSIRSGLAFLRQERLVAGPGTTAVNPIAGAFFYERVPEHMMARVQGISTALGWGGIPFGALLGGIAAQGLGIDAALLAFGAAYLIVTLSPLIWPSWRQLDRRTPAETGSPVPLRAVDAH